MEITCIYNEEFIDIIAGLVQAGVEFKAHKDENGYVIILTGGY